MNWLSTSLKFTGVLSPLRIKFKPKRARAFFYAVHFDKLSKYNVLNLQYPKTYESDMAESQDADAGSAEEDHEEISLSLGAEKIGTSVPGRLRSKHVQSMLISPPLVVFDLQGSQGGWGQALGGLG